MTQSTLTKPETATSTPSDSHEIDVSSLESIIFDGNDSGENGENAPLQATDSRYKLLIDEGVVEKISSLAAQKIDGIIDMKGSVFSMIQEGLGGNDRKKGVNADVMDENNAKVDLSVILEYGKSATDVFEQLKDVIAKDVNEMTGLNVVEMTVNVVDVMDEEEFNQKRGITSSNNSDDSKDGGASSKSDKSDK